MVVRPLSLWDFPYMISGIPQACGIIRLRVPGSFLRHNWSFKALEDSRRPLGHFRVSLPCSASGHVTNDNRNGFKNLNEGRTKTRKSQQYWEILNAEGRRKQKIDLLGGKGEPIQVNVQDLQVESDHQQFFQEPISLNLRSICNNLLALS
jgi:hypothetical protein